MRGLSQKRTLGKVVVAQRKEGMSHEGTLGNLDETAALPSVHTASFPALLQQLHTSLVLTTYQAHKLVVVRADGDSLNTHFCAMERPMGLALDGGRLAIGTQLQIRDFRNVSEVAPKLEPAGRYDACFLPRRGHVTGDIDVHEMAFVPGGALWLVNTRFSCLCTLDLESSFVPRWRPGFVSGLSPEDRCHLNGLAIRDRQPRYVTALGATDTREGWRHNKTQGGILMDVSQDAIITGGLSMPHSPRWHDGRIWLLESGTGGLGVVDPATGDYETVVRLPGFTRGLDFVGSLAFVGLSQVRETAVFSGIPITERLPERACGVWVVDVQTGQTIATLRFEDGVQEIFAVQALPGISFPEVLNEDEKTIAATYVLPDDALKDVKFADKA